MEHEKRKQIVEQKSKDGKLPKLDSYFKKTVESTLENNITDICQILTNIDDFDKLLSKNMENICAKQCPAYIAKLCTKISCVYR